MPVVPGSRTLSRSIIAQRSPLRLAEGPRSGGALWWCAGGGPGGRADPESPLGTQDGSPLLDLEAVNPSFHQRQPGSSGWGPTQ
jgi:hypothetical protein